MNIKETNEQTIIIKQDFNSLMINAFAGTGKTTTLVKFAENRPSYKILYLAFNKSIADEARGKFPNNVSVVTAHSIAYKKVGFRYKHKLTGLRYLDIKTLLRENFSYSNNLLNLLSKELLISINDFCYSSYKTIKDSVNYQKNYPINREEYSKILEYIWSEMVSLDSSFPITHDFYLKLFQLQGYPLNFDYILFDEAQDANPAIVDIVLTQHKKYNSKVVFIGDFHQSIYSFRGAENIFRKIKTEGNLYLTQSFRFGENISMVLNAILKTLKNEEKTIRGNLNVKDFVGQIDIEKQFTILTRTNANLFLKACELAEKNKTMYFVGGFDSYQFYKIRDVENLYNGKYERIKDSYISSFENFESFYKEIEEIEDKELIFLSKIVDKYKGNTFEIINKIKSLIRTQENQAKIILSTVHKSKGLEFNQVWLANDFVDFIDDEGNITLKALKDEEINILYVAASRAKHALRINWSLKKILDYYRDHFETIENKTKNKTKNKNKSVIKFESKLKKFNNKLNKDVD